MFKLTKNGLTIGRHYQTFEEAQAGRRQYIREHAKHYAGQVQGQYYDTGRIVLFSECESIAESMLNAEISIREVE